MNQKYGGLIWTNHAIQRMYERGISQGDAWATWRNPQQSRYAANKGAWIYYRDYNGQRIEVVAKQNDKKEWIVLSVWSKKIENEGFKKDKFKKSSFLSNIIKKILFG